MAQLRLRYRAAAAVAAMYSDAGFTVVYQDTILGPILTEMIELYRGRRLHVFVLRPRAPIVALRQANRDKQGLYPFRCGLVTGGPGDNP